jgi:membrane fusion protein (multidrug efflux system)
VRVSLITAAEANVRTAELNLGYTRITAPIDGRIGRAAFTLGNLVAPDSCALARLVQLEPIRAVFSVDDRALIDAKLRVP